MISHRDTLISDEIKEQQFVCDLEKCKGACCVEGELGAPLEDNELEILHEIYDKVEPYLSEEGKQAIAAQGKYVFDRDGDFSTPTLNGKECAYAVYDEQGILKCGIEQAHQAGKINFQKPISCHLYPVRISKHKDYDAVNYSHWHICDDACVLGEHLKVPVYKFVKEALVRKYGEEWYAALEKLIEEDS